MKILKIKHGENFAISESADVDKIAPSYNDGLIKISLPQREETKKKPLRNIKIPN